jgi:hypothetical protein
MAITKDVNTALLNDCFELTSFHGLCKPSPDDVIEPSADEEPSTPRKSKF